MKTNAVEWTKNMKVVKKLAAVDEACMGIFCSRL